MKFIPTNTKTSEALKTLSENANSTKFLSEIRQTISGGFNHLKEQIDGKAKEDELSPLDAYNERLYEMDDANENLTHVRQMHPTKGMRYISKRRLQAQGDVEAMMHFWPRIAAGVK